ncbi:MAG: hypothetical protein ACP5MD_06875 [Verrucomicrobiia bacterium]
MVALLAISLAMAAGNNASDDMEVSGQVLNISSIGVVLPGQIPPQVQHTLGSAPTYLSFAHPEFPPLPFNPFPDLPVLGMRGDQFLYLYDDRGVNYDQLRADAQARAAEDTLSARVNQPATLSSEPSETLYVERVPDEMVKLTGDLEQNAGYVLLSKTNLSELCWKAEMTFFTPAEDDWPGETFPATLPMKYFELAKQPDTVVSIEKNDDAIEPTPGQPGSGKNGRFTIWRESANGDYSSSLAVHYTISGSAINGSDYQQIASVATIPSFSPLVLVEVAPISDDNNEFDETVTLTVQQTTPITYFIKRDEGAATVTIFDRQPQFAVVVQRSGGPIGIDYHPVEQGLLISDNWWYGGLPQNFTCIKKVNNQIQCIQWSQASGLDDEIKVATVKETVANFVCGDMFFGYKPAEGSTRIGRVYRSGNDILFTLDWAVLEQQNPPIAETCPVHGGLYIDQTGLFNHDLIVVTGGGHTEGGRVWRITSNADHSSNTKTVFAEVPNTHMEGVVTLPNDTAKYGPWAGRIVTGSETREPAPVICTIDQNGNVAEYAEGVAPEDFDIIPGGQGLYCNDGYSGLIYKVPATYFADYAGDLLVTQAGEVWSYPAALIVFHWDQGEGRFQKKSILPPEGVQFEHVTSAPIDL